MNEVFIIGKVISKIDYKFIINNKKQFAKAEFVLECDKQKIRVTGFNNIADFCLKYLKENNYTFINGKLQSNRILKIKVMKIL